MAPAQVHGAEPQGATLDKHKERLGREIAEEQAKLLRAAKEYREPLLQPKATTE